ncbi:MAG: hypothetical protein ACLQU5_01320 [Isosphaeraceae bacterium]
MTKTIHGRIHGKTIELDEDLGVAAGQEVEVQVTVVQTARKWGEGILRTAGALADDTEWDGISLFAVSDFVFGFENSS